MTLNQKNSSMPFNWTITLNSWKMIKIGSINIKLKILKRWIIWNSIRFYAILFTLISWKALNPDYLFAHCSKIQFQSFLILKELMKVFDNKAYFFHGGGNCICFHMSNGLPQRKLHIILSYILSLLHCFFSINEIHEQICSESNKDRIHIAWIFCIILVFISLDLIFAFWQG